VPCRAPLRNRAAAAQKVARGLIAPAASGPDFSCNFTNLPAIDIKAAGY
jgi:hypothetical protein